MSKRLCKSWLDSYMEYTEHTEPPDSYHQWCGLFAIASSLKRQIYLNMGHYKVYPNLYLVLVGPPAARKNAAITLAIDLIMDVPGVKLTADAITKEALIRALATSKQQILLPNNEVYEHSSLTAVCKELSVFLGSNNLDFLALLTDLYDNHKRWEYRTKNMGIDVIYNEWLNLLGGTTPSSLAGSNLLEAIGMGFVSRVLFVVEHSPKKRIARHLRTLNEIQLQSDLKHDLEQISMMCGEMTLEGEDDLWYQQWYEKENIKLSHDIRFDGYYGRKHVHLLKVASLISASLSDEMKITKAHLKFALYLIEQLEDNMIGAFGAAGRNILAQDIDAVLKYIQENGRLSRNQILHAVWRDVNPKDIDIVLRSLCDMKMIMLGKTESGSFYYEVFKEEIKSV